MKRERGLGKITPGLAVVVSFLGQIAAAQKTEECTYKVAPKAVISITNNYGPIAVKPSRNRQVVITAVSHSDAVSFHNEQHGNRIEIRSRSMTPATGLAEYTVLVPSDSWVALHSLEGTLSAEGLNGDLMLKAATASVEVSDISDAHIHVKTLSGPITLTSIRNSHLDVRSVSGNVGLHNVKGSLVEVNSGSGRILYDCDPGTNGKYLLTSHSGDIDVSIPAKASVEIKARSLKGESDQGFTNSDTIPATRQKDLLMKPGIVNASRFVLRSFKGKIHMKRP